MQLRLDGAAGRGRRESGETHPDQVAKRVGSQGLERMGPCSLDPASVRAREAIGHSPTNPDQDACCTPGNREGPTVKEAVQLTCPAAVCKVRSRGLPGGGGPDEGGGVAGEGKGVPGRVGERARPELRALEAVRPPPSEL